VRFSIVLMIEVMAWSLPFTWSPKIIQPCPQILDCGNVVDEADSDKRTSLQLLWSLKVL